MFSYSSNIVYSIRNAHLGPTVFLHRPFRFYYPLLSSSFLGNSVNILSLFHVNPSIRDIFAIEITTFVLLLLKITTRPGIIKKIFIADNIFINLFTNRREKRFTTHSGCTKTNLILRGKNE